MGGVSWPFQMKEIKWIRLLAYVTGLVNQELLLQNEYLAAENRVLRAHLPARLRLSDPERSSLAEIGKRLGPSAAFVVGRGSAACSNTTATPHEYFDHKRVIPGKSFLVAVERITTMPFGGPSRA